MKKVSIILVMCFSLAFFSCGLESKAKSSIGNEVKKETLSAKQNHEVKVAKKTKNKTNEESVDLPDINNFWDKNNNYLDLKSYLYACGAISVSDGYYTGSDKIIRYIANIYNYKIFIYTINEGNVANLIFGKAEDDIIAYYNFNREEHQILMTVVDKETGTLVHTETLEVLPELIKALYKSDGIPKLKNYTYTEAYR